MKIDDFRTQLWEWKFSLIWKPPQNIRQPQIYDNPKKGNDPKTKTTQRERQNEDVPHIYEDGHKNEGSKMENNQQNEDNTKMNSTPKMKKGKTLSLNILRVPLIKQVWGTTT